MGRIERLTPEQEARLPEYAERWTRIGLCTDPADRPLAEQGIIAAYRAANLAPPERIVWCDSPVSMVLTRATLLEMKNPSVGASVRDSVEASVRDSVEASVGASVRDSVWASVGASVRASVEASVRDSVEASVRDSVEASVGASVRDSVWASVGASVRASVWASVRASVWDSVWDSVRDSVRDSVEASVWASVRASVRASVWDSVRDSVWDSVRDSVEASVWASVWDSGYGQHDANWLGFYAYFREVLGLTTETEALCGLTQIAESAGWFLPHARICWVSERHDTVKQDTTNRLHCEDGPAVHYPDGWSIYAWHGVRIPANRAWIIEQPAAITPSAIQQEGNAELRRIMLLKYGLPRYLDDVGAREIDRDHDLHGERVLYELRDPLGPIRMVTVQNSTPEAGTGEHKDYTFRVPPDVPSCRAAVAYLYGMRADDYAVVAES